MQKLQPVDFLPFAEETSGDTDAKLFPQLRSDFCQGRLHVVQLSFSQQQQIIYKRFSAALGLGGTHAL